MASMCSLCGKTLMYRDTFTWKNQPVCRTCLDKQTGVATDPAKAAPETNTGQDEIRHIYKQLKSGGIGSILFGIIAIGAGLATAQADPVNIVVAVLGFFLLAEGLWLLISPRPAGLIADGAALCILGIWNILITIYNASHGGGGGAFAFLGILQIVWGVQSFRRYTRLKSLAVQGISAVPDAGPHPFHSLFDKGLGGANLLIIAVYFGEWILVSAFLPLVRTLFGGGIHYMPFLSYPFFGSLVLLSAGLLCLLGYRIRDMWNLAFIYAGARLAGSILIQLIFSLISKDQFAFNPASDLPHMVSHLLWGVLFIVVLYSVISHWGVRFWPMALSLMALSVLSSLLSQGIQRVFDVHARFALSVPYFIQIVLSGILFGVFLYLAFSLVQRRRRIPAAA